MLQLKDLRALLRGAGRNEEGAALFTSLYRSWCHSLGAVLSLCFLIEVCCPSVNSKLSRKASLHHTGGEQVHPAISHHHSRAEPELLRVNCPGCA